MSILTKLGFEEPEPELSKEAQSYITDAKFNSQNVHDLAKKSLDFLAAIAMPTIFKYCFPPVFNAIWNWILSYVNKTRDFSQLAIGLPRGFGKTTFIKIFVLFCILFTNKKFILIISNTATLAENILSDIVDMLEEPNIKKVFGDWKLGIEKDTQALKKFGYRGRNIILAGIGAGSSLRGLNIKNERPDVMIFEDIQSREDAESKQLADQIEKWMVGTAMKAKSPAGCLFIFVANMYPTEGSLLRRLKNNSNWIKFIAGGLLADGSSLWEELQPKEQLLREFQNDLASGHPEIFYAEVLNDENAHANTLIDLSILPSCPYANDDIHQGNFIMIDPATAKEHSDFVSIGYFEVFDGIPVLQQVIEDRLSPAENIRVATTMALDNNCRLIVVESNAYQSTLCYWFNFIWQQMGIIGLEVVEIYSGVHSKNSRIMNMLKSYSKGELFVHVNAKAKVHNQITQWNPLKTNNTDGILDLLTYAPKILETFGEYIKSLTIIQEQEFVATRVPAFNSPF